MRGSHGIDIVLLHQHDIHLHLICSAVKPGIGITVVAIYPPEFDGYSVHFYNTVLNFDITKTYLFTDKLFSGGYPEIIQRRYFGRPKYPSRSVL